MKLIREQLRPVDDDYIFKPGDKVVWWPYDRQDNEWSAWEVVSKSSKTVKYYHEFIANCIDRSDGIRRLENTIHLQKHTAVGWFWYEDEFTTWVNKVRAEAGKAACELAR